jgi:hypothetical protein
MILVIDTMEKVGCAKGVGLQDSRGSRREPLLLIAVATGFQPVLGM